MFIPVWVFWILYMMIFGILAYKSGKSKGLYAPWVVGIAIVLIGIAFPLEFFLSKWLS